MKGVCVLLLVAGTALMLAARGACQGIKAALGVYIVRAGSKRSRFATLR
jgi:hypothetical protein